MKLEEIGFYTLSDDRARKVSWNSPMQRCEMILTDRCNFRCAYCRGPRDEWKGDMDYSIALSVLRYWCQDGLRNIRFSGGEPLLYPHLEPLVMHAKLWGVQRIAISSNGSLPQNRYARLLNFGVNDFSISLDACCAAGCKKMSGGVDAFDRIKANIQYLSKHCYVTVGVVLNDENVDEILGIIRIAHELGASDIRIISAAQQTDAIMRIKDVLREIPNEILRSMPILRYRVGHILSESRNVRGIKESDCRECHLLKDDSVVAGKYYYPCVIYMREHGDPIGEVSPNMREDRRKFFEHHNSFLDPICRNNCLDVCIDHNNTCAKFLCKE